MRQKPGTVKPSAESNVKDIRRRTRKHHSAEEKITIVLEGLRGEDSIAELCRREGIATSLYYSWSKEFLEAGKKRLAGDTARHATRPEVKDLRQEAATLKEVLADLTLENRLLKKACSGMGKTRNDVSCIREARNHPTGRGVAFAVEAWCWPDLPKAPSSSDRAPLSPAANLPLARATPLKTKQCPFSF